MVPLLQRVTFGKSARNAGPAKSNQKRFAPGLARLRRVPALRRRSVGPRRTDIHVLTALSRHPCRSTHSASSTFGLHPSRVWRCLDCRVQEQLGLELTLIAFLIVHQLSARHPVGARLPAICWEPAANPVHAVYQVQPSRLILLPLRGRSRASALLHVQRQPDVSVSGFDLAFHARQSRRHTSRLGCRLNAGDAQWVERHGCRESAVRAWMPVRRGPTERRRSEGTSTKSRPNREHRPLVTWGLFK
jgi:hypothetical protein